MNLRIGPICLILIKEWGLYIMEFAFTRCFSSSNGLGRIQQIELLNRTTSNIKRLFAKRIFFWKKDGHLICIFPGLLWDEVQTMVNILTSTHQQIIKAGFFGHKCITLITEGITNLS